MKKISKKDREAVLETIDLSKGFVKGNVLVVSRAASRMLKKLSPKERKMLMEQALERSASTKPGPQVRGE